MLERKILQFPVSCIEAQAVCDWRIDVKCLPRNSVPFVARYIAKRAHVVCAISKLDQNDPDVTRHCQQHLAK